MSKHWIWLGLAAAVAVVLLSPLASSFPDGLERVAQDRGFVEAARDAPFEVLPDYVFPHVNNRGLATIAAGVLGTLATFGVSWGVGRWLARRRVES